MAADDNEAMTPLPPTAADLQGALPLSDWGLIRAQGEDARSFLHGQLTQDVSGLDAGHARLAGYCSAKGRLLASFVMWAPAPDTVLLACSADLLPTTLKRLSMFVLRAKCKLVDASAEVALWGLAGTGAAALLGPAALAGDWAVHQHGEATVIRLPDAGEQGAAVPRWLWAAPAAAAAPALQALPPAVWAWLEATSGVARIVAATSEQFVPQMVNLELVGGVNFQKGCYPGQEVVARSQYRGTLKRRAQVLTSTVPMASGQEVFHSADPGQPAGLVALAGSRSAQQHAALVELKLAALPGGSLHLGAADGPVLQLAALPYALPSEAA
jgi:folate-binding protein YgfZ